MRRAWRYGMILAAVLCTTPCAAAAWVSDGAPLSAVELDAVPPSLLSPVENDRSPVDPYRPIQAVVLVLVALIVARRMRPCDVPANPGD